MEETFNQSRAWVYKAIGLLSFNGGFVNSITFESFFHNPVGYVTGNITLAAYFLVSNEWLSLIYIAGAIFSFLFGSVLSGLIIPKDNLTQNNNYNLVFVLEIILIFLGGIGLYYALGVSKYLLAMALGLQNGLTTFYGKSIIRTTHMTGTVTDLGLAIANKLKGNQIPSWRINIYVLLLVGFSSGSILGIIFFKSFSYYSLGLSILICLSMLKLRLDSDKASERETSP